MNQKSIRAFNDTQYTKLETEELVTELFDRTNSSQTGYNSIDELATILKTVEGAYTLDIVANYLVLKKENVVLSTMDLSVYIDDTNLSRLTGGSINPGTNIATFTRDDNSTFEIDFSNLADIKEVGYSDLKAEFTARVLIASSDVDFSIGAVFYKTLDAPTTLTFSNTEIGLIKTMVITPAGFALSLTGNLTIGSEFKTDAVNHIQIECTDTNEFWISISQTII